MSLINCKTDLKLKWTNCYILSGSGADNDDSNLNKIILTIRNSKLYVPVSTLSGNDNQNLPKLLSEGSERSVYWKEYKTKSDKRV